MVGPIAGLVLALTASRAVAKIVGIALGNIGSGASAQQALWVGCAMTPMSSAALLLVSQFIAASPMLGKEIANVALPAILVMEILGAVLTTVAIYRAGESSKPWLLNLRPAAPSPACVHVPMPGGTHLGPNHAPALLPAPSTECLHAS